MTTVSLMPWLSVRRGAVALAFYKQAFDAVELFLIQSDDGAVVAQLSIDGAIFWMSDESPENKNFSPESLGGGTVKLVLTVPDPHTTFAKAVAVGASIVHEVVEEHGWLIGRVADPFGHHWEIGKQLEE